jgi:hypothetical protein
VPLAIGKTRWAIAEGYIPPDDPHKTRELVSHEALCILNAGDQDAHIEITVFFSDREPVGPYRFTIAGRRTRHLRLNDFSDPQPLPVNTDFSTLIESDVPIVIQHTRLDSRQPALALLSTIGYTE